MPRTGQAALDWCAARVNNPSPNWFNICLIFSRRAFDVSARYGDAATAWRNAGFKHGTSGTPPAAVPVWWTGGRQGFGHVAVSIGNGDCYSSDILRRGRIDRVPIALITRNWGLTYRGWTEDINGVRVYSLPPGFVSLPAVDWSNVRDALLRNALENPTLQAPDLLRVERALQAEGLLPSDKPAPGFTGTRWRQAYAEWQRRSGVGGPYDGMPGMASLTRLGARHRFRVVR